MNKFTETAKEALGGCKLMQNRTKITTEDMIKFYPNGFTVTGFDFLTKSDGDGYAVMIFAEDNTKYFNCGALATKVATAWANAYDGDIETASAELAACGGAKFKMSTKKTKTGKTITAFDPVD